MIYAKELQQQLERQGLSQRELASRMGLSPARISQWLSILRLPGEVLTEIESLGDCWNRREITERELRILRRTDPATGEQPF